MGEGQEVDFLTEIEGKMVCGKSFIFPMVGGSGLAFPPSAGFLGRNWIACFWTSEAVDEGVLLRSRMMTEQDCVCMELGKDCVGLNSLWSSQAFYLWLLKASQASLLCICSSIYVASQAA